MLKRTFLLLLLGLAAQALAAQTGFSYAIRAGLNFSSINGPSENESFRTVTGFHIGPAFSYGFTEQWGASLELQYSQKGGRYSYEGPSFFPFSTPAGSVLSTGERREIVSSVLSYIDMPILLTYRPVDRVRLSAGLNVAVLLNATGSGEIIYEGSTPNGAPIESFTLALDYDYDSDAPGGFPNSSSTVPVAVDNQVVELPGSIGAYYFESTDEGQLFLPFDLGLNAGLQYYLTPGVSVGARVNYGLLDVSNNAVDYSRSSPNTRSSDYDRNLSYQISLAFNFY